MIQRSINLVLFITLATQAAGLFIQNPQTFTYGHRQVAQPPQPTLPSNYWWPFASLNTATTTVPVTMVMPPTIVASVSSPILFSDSTSTSTSTLDTSSSSTTSSSSSSSISDTSTTSIYPQQTTPTSHSHVSRLSMPIIASIVGGAVAICVLILLLCRCCTRRRREYTTRRTSRRRRDTGDAEKGWRRVSWENNQQERSWWNTMFSTRGGEVEDVIPGPRYVGVDEIERSLILGRDETSVAGRAGHDELLLARSIRRPNYMLSSQPLMSSRSMSTTAAELDNDANDEVEDDDYDIPWESLRHKSIKRAILAKVDEEKKWTDSMRGTRAANANAAKVGRRQTHVKCDSDFWLDAGEGFRIITESPPQIPTPPSKTWTSLASSFPFLSSGADEEVEDRYTPAPARMRSNSNSRSRRGSVTSPLRVVERRTNGAVQVLLRSPPTVMSPEMESALCFSPVLSAFDRSEYVENTDSNDIVGRHSGPTGLRAGQEQMQGQRSGDTSPPGTAFTKTYRLRTDRALKRVEAIVESGWTEREVATRISTAV